MLTTKDAASRLGITARAVALLIQRKVIRAEKFGRDYQIDPAEVERYERERRPAHRPKRDDDEHES